jgi:biopolymer transport protein ExbB
MNSFNSIEFIVAGGTVSIIVALILLVMSVASWYLIMTRAYGIFKKQRQLNVYIQQFWRTENLEKASAIADQSGLSSITKRAIAASQHYQQITTKNQDICNKDEFIAREINREIATKSEALQQGLSVLASVGSIAPFVGLFGTVWGIYHALFTIAQTGQATLDKVAGPVGEALIMTAVGLAVAIPAVLAYNAILSANRSIISKIEQFSETLHTLLTTGAIIQSPTTKTSQDSFRVIEGTK